MDNLSVGKMPLSEPDSRPPPITPKGPYDLQATFVCSIKLSAQNLYKLLKKKLPPKVDIVNFYLSNSRISICSAVSLSSAKKHITVIVPTNEPRSFGVCPGDFGFCLRMMIPGKEIHRIVLTYKTEEGLLLLEDGQTKVCLETVPCTKKGKASIVSFPWSKKGKASIDTVPRIKEGNKIDTAPEKEKAPIDTVPCTKEGNTPEKGKASIDTVPCTKEVNKLVTS
ncbi:hypothetical protein MKW92_001198 [Papaver armeniacum]|nr:hypothetical protein MKW92_001198 [Papaver armeniacum]